jgi:hypothetical protein
VNFLAFTQWQGLKRSKKTLFIHRLKLSDHDTLIVSCLF